MFFMKKILFVTNSLSIGGVEKVLINIANNLSKYDFDITILLLFPGMEMASQLNNKIKLLYKPLKKHPILRYIPILRKQIKDYGQYETNASAKELYSYYIGSEKYDIEIAFIRGLPVKIISGSTNENSLKIAWVHSDFKKCFGVTSFFQSLEDTKNAYRKFQHIICVSNQVKDSFIDIIGCADKVKVIYNMVDSNDILTKSQMVCPLTKDRFTILTVGRLFEAKAYDRLLKVVSLLNQDNLSFDLWIIGEGAERNKLEQIICEKKITNVKLLGAIHNPYPYMRISDLYICSSIYEGFNLTLVEALICGMPTISTKCAGPCEILQNGLYGLIVDNATESIYSSLKEVIKKQIDMRLFQKKAQVRGMDFDIKHLLPKIIDILR